MAHIAISTISAAIMDGTSIAIHIVDVASDATDDASADTDVTGTGMHNNTVMDV
jgi:hypothetical protein